MKHDFLSDLLSNPVRAQILRVFIYNLSGSFTIADVLKRSHASEQAALRELRALERLHILKKGKAFPPKEDAVKSKVKSKKSKQKNVKAKKEIVWSYNPEFKFKEMLSSFVQDVSPARYDLIMKALRRTGKVSAVVLSGVFMGDSTRPADLLVAADGLNEGRLEYAVKALEPVFGREIRYAAFSTPEFRYRMTIQDRLLRDTLDYPHIVLLDRAHLLTL